MSLSTLLNYLCFSSLSFHKLVNDNKRLSEAAGHVRVAVSYIICNEFCMMCIMHLRLIRLNYNFGDGLHLAHRITSPVFISYILLLSYHLRTS